ncbi:MAG: hypothetical protein P8Z75_00960 [Gammaproteobacteria bacterium]
MSRATVKTWLDRLCGFGLALYPFIAHLCLSLHVPEYAVAYLVALFVLYLLNTGGRQTRILRLVLAITLPFGMLLWARYFAVSDWLYLPPIVLPLWAGVFFLRSLRRPGDAIISRIARLMEGAPLEQVHLAYTRRITLVWGIVLLGMSLEAGLLAWLAPIIVWSWWVNIGNSVILLLLLLLELPVRWLRLGKPPRFAHMCRVMLKRSWLDTGKR